MYHYCRNFKSHKLLLILGIFSSNPLACFYTMGSVYIPYNIVTQVYSYVITDILVTKIICHRNIIQLK